MSEPLKMDIEAIMRQLPHRYPFLLVDRVLECEPGECILALKNVTFNEPFFPGHFPHRPVMPGVMIIEALAQASGILAFKTVEVVPDPDTRFYFVAIDNASFRKPVEPGDQVMLKATLKRAFKGIWKFQCAAEVDGAEVASAEIMVAPETKAPESRPEERAMIDARAVYRRKRKLPMTCTIGPFTIIGADVVVGPGTWIGPHVVINGPTRIGADNKIFQFASIGDAPQDKKYRGRADAARDRRPQRVSRIRHRQPRHDARSRRDAHRQRQSVHGLFARRARLPPRRPDRDGQLRDARRPRGARRLGDHGRLVRRASAYQGRRALLPRAQRRGHARRAAVRHGGRPAGGAAQRQFGGPEAPRIHGRTDPQHPPRLPGPVPVRAEAAGGARGARNGRRRPARDPALSSISSSAARAASFGSR